MAWLSPISAGVVGSLMMISSQAPAQSQHITDAVTHAQAGVVQGHQGYPDALVTQAQEALTHTEAAKKEMNNPHLDEGIRLLKSAIDHGKQGHSEPAIRDLENALTHLWAVEHPPAEASEDDGY
ncbi:MAG: small metal-binding protein SmbP [Nitrospirales bacterium]